MKPSFTLPLVLDYSDQFLTRDLKTQIGFYKVAKIDRPSFLSNFQFKPKAKTIAPQVHFDFSDHFLTRAVKLKIGYYKVAKLDRPSFLSNFQFKPKP